MNSSHYSLSILLGKQLKAAALQITTAESCTAGGVASAITAVPGSSGWFEAGFITYSNAMKSAVLGVDQCLLSEFGAVSEEVASAMLMGALNVSNADVGVAVTGIAGPGGATKAKSVGTVCFAWGAKASVNRVTCSFDGDREAVREAAVKKALLLAIGYLEERNSQSTV